jgi:hypothetical protein
MSSTIRPNNLGGQNLNRTGVTSDGRTAVSETVSTQVMNHQYSVDAKNNMVEPKVLHQAAQGDVKANEAAQQKAAFSLGIDSTSSYQINAEGKVGHGAFWGTKVGAEDKTDFTQREGGTRTGRGVRGGQNVTHEQTRLQFGVHGPDGKMIERLDYQPNMTVDGSKYPAGSSIKGYFSDTNRHDNHGQIKVDIKQTDVTKVEQKVVTQASAKDVVEAAKPTIAADSTVAAATVPSPTTDRARMAPEKALEVDRDANTIRTQGGYAFEVGKNGVSVHEPGGKAGTHFDFENQRWTESDGTTGNLNAEMIKARWVNGDTSAFSFKTDANGRVTGMTIGNDDAKVDVSGFGSGAQPRISDAKSGGLKWRAGEFENPERLTNYNGGFGSGAQGTVADDKQTGWFATQAGRPLGWLQAHGSGDNAVDTRFGGYVVDQNQRPKLGTPAYEKAIQNGIAQNLGESAGALRHYGLDRQSAYDAAYQYSQPYREQLGQYGLLNQLAQQYPAVQNLFGGMPQAHPSMTMGMQSLVQLFQLLSMQQAMAGSFQRPIMI